MTIEEITVYETMGRQFRSIEKANEFRYNAVVEFIFRPGFGVPHRERIALADYLTDNREDLRKLLDY